MISRIRGTLLARDLDSVEVLTAGGVAYQIAIPRSVYERLPAEGKDLEILTHQVVREDAHMLFGFLDPVERTIFTRLLTASGVGPRLALALLSALPAARLVTALRERDIPALTAVSGVGKKTAERLALDLASKLDDIPVAASARGTRGAASAEAVRALTVLGFNAADAERAVRQASEKNGALEPNELVKSALTFLR